MACTRGSYLPNIVFGCLTKMVGLTVKRFPSTSSVTFSPPLLGGVSTTDDFLGISEWCREGEETVSSPPDLVLYAMVLRFSSHQANGRRQRRRYTSTHTGLTRRDDVAD